MSLYIWVALSWSGMEGEETLLGKGPVRNLKGRAGGIRSLFGIYLLHYNSHSLVH